MKSVAFCICALLAVTHGFQLSMYQGNGVSDRNDPWKPSRREALSNEGKTAVRNFVEPDNPMVDGAKPNGRSGNYGGRGGNSGGNWFTNLFGGGAKKVKEAAEGITQTQGEGKQIYGRSANSASNVDNSQWKASRFRAAPERQEGKTAIRAFNPPSPSRGPTKPSQQKWDIPSKFDSALGPQNSREIRMRADKYMRGAISARDMAATLTKMNLGEMGPEIIGTMPPGEKRSALFKLFTQF